MQALQRANEVRLARAELKRGIAEGRTTVGEVILECPWEAASMTVTELLLSQRRWGTSRCAKFLADIGMSSTQLVGSLSDRQRMFLAALFPERASARDAEPTRDPTGHEDHGPAWDELAGIARRCEELSSELDGLTSRRDELIRKLSEAGASRRAVAAAASLTVGRVQQIVDQGQRASLADVVVTSKPAPESP